MFGLWSSSCRFYHTSRTIFSASMLGKLRKSTGFTISNCKKALQQFPDDLQKAEEWLQAESKKMGWSKWNKIQSRSAAQGLVGVYAQGNLGVMVEVNCETDFVAKNVEFRNLVGSVLIGCLEKSKEYEVAQDKEFQKCLLNEADLMNLQCESVALQELLNAAVSKFNEKTVFRRAVVLKAKPSVSIAGLSHPTEQCPNFQEFQTGKFGALVVYHPKNEESTFGMNMCQHIIGMNPLSLGADDFQRLCALGKLNLEGGEPPLSEDGGAAPLPPQEGGGDKEEEEVELMKDSDESRLLFQPYLLDPNLNVYNYAWKQADILDYERFECGG